MTRKRRLLLGCCCTGSCALRSELAGTGFVPVGATCGPDPEASDRTGAAEQQGNSTRENPDARRR